MKWKPRCSRGEAETSFWWDYWRSCPLTPGAAITDEGPILRSEKTGLTGDIPATFLHFRPSYLKYIDQCNIHHINTCNIHSEFTIWGSVQTEEACAVGLRGFSSRQPQLRTSDAHITASRLQRKYFCIMGTDEVERGVLISLYTRTVFQ